MIGVVILVCTLLSEQEGISGIMSTPVINDPTLKAEIVYQGINFPTNMAFLGPDDILVIEKDTGMIKRIVNGQLFGDVLIDLPVSNKGERGLLGIAIPVAEEDQDRKVFIYYSESPTRTDDYEDDPLGNRLYEYVLENDNLTRSKLLLDVPFHSPGGTGYHVGGELLLGPDQNLYLTAGDMNQDKTKSQNIDSQDSHGSGVIYRVTQDGKPAEDNPLDGDGPVDAFFAYGIRNSFGMDFDPVTGNLWDTENGPWFGDEINLVEPGFNSGWSKIQGMSSLVDDFELDSLVKFDGKSEYSDPRLVWNETVGVTALKFLDSDEYGEAYKHDLFVGDVKYGNLYHFDLNQERDQLKLKGDLSDKVANREDLSPYIFGEGFGGIVDMQIGPDGYLYILSITAFNGLSSSLAEKDGLGTIYRIIPR